LCPLAVILLTTSRFRVARDRSGIGKRWANRQDLFRRITSCSDFRLWGDPTAKWNRRTDTCLVFCRLVELAPKVANGSEKGLAEQAKVRTTSGAANA
jgi:hypothetical protein